MFTSILVGLDGSLASQVALSQSILIGQRFRARLVLVHVVPLPGHTGEMSLGAPWMEYTSAHVPTGRAELERAAEEMLSDAAGAVRRAGLEVETVVRDGPTIEVLREMAEQVGVVVVGRRGVRGEMSAVMGEDPLGPDTRELVRRSSRPVLVAGAIPTSMDRVLVAYDGSVNSESALAFASRFAGITGAHLDVVHVNEDAEEGRRMLARASGALSVSQLDFDTHLIAGDIAAAITDTVPRLGSSALFVGAHREETGWKIPTHTEVILRATDIPVLVHMQPASSGARSSAAYRRPSS
jgi:nucleotide-binding universal stress UspA family protein